MSWWISLDDEGKPVEVKSFQGGGTQCIGGSTEADLNVTYNYSEVTRLVDFGFRNLDGRTAEDTIDELERVVAALGTQQFENYWAPTPGNAGFAASILLSWAKQHPKAVWRVD
jgi:hypothetical protein